MPNELPPLAPPWEPLFEAMDDETPTQAESRAERLERILSGAPRGVMTAARYFTDEAAAEAERLAREAGDPPGAADGL